MQNFAFSAICLGITFSYVIAQFSTILANCNPF